MSWFNEESKRKALTVFLAIECAFLLFWWPLSHWLYPDLYHGLLGFHKGTYQDSMVKVIGTCGFAFVLLLFLSALNPTRNKDMITVLIVFSLLIAATYAYLVAIRAFPARELINVGVSLTTAAILLVLYPHGRKGAFKQPRQ